MTDSSFPAALGRALGLAAAVLAVVLVGYGAYSLAGGGTDPAERQAREFTSSSAETTSRSSS